MARLILYPSRFEPILPPAAPPPVVWGWQTSTTDPQPRRARIDGGAINVFALEKFPVVVGWNFERPQHLTTPKPKTLGGSINVFALEKFPVVFGWHPEYPALRSPTPKSLGGLFWPPYPVDIPPPPVVEFGWYMQRAPIVRRPSIQHQTTFFVATVAQAPLAWGWYVQSAMPVARRRPVMPEAVQPTLFVDVRPTWLPDTSQPVQRRGRFATQPSWGAFAPPAAVHGWGAETPEPLRYRAKLPDSALAWSGFTPAPPPPETVVWGWYQPFVDPRKPRISPVVLTIPVSPIHIGASPDPLFTVVGRLRQRVVVGQIRLRTIRKGFN